MKVTLSFDNGPTPGVTERVLDRLSEYDVAAIFFVVGEHLLDDDAAALARHAAGLGHRVGGHTWSHATPFGELDDRGVDAELDRTRRAVEAIGGESLLFRPYGVGGVIDDRLMSPHGARRLRDDGFTCVLWTSVPGDWLDPDGWIDDAVRDVTSSDWSVVVLHDIADAADRRLDEFLGRLRESGAEFVSETPDVCTPIRAGSPTSSYGLLGVADPID